MDFKSTFFVRNGLDFTSTVFMIYRGHFFMIYRGHFLFAMGVMYHFLQVASSLGYFFLCHHLNQFLIMVLSAIEFADKMERHVFYQSKNKLLPVQKRSLLN